MNVFDMVGLMPNDILKFSMHPGRYEPLKWHGIKPTPVSRPFKEWNDASAETLEIWASMENAIVNGAVDIRNIDTGEVFERVNCRALTIVGRRAADD